MRDQFKAILLLLILSSISITLFPNTYAESNDTIRYLINVDSVDLSGRVIINIEIEDYPKAFWLTVPKDWPLSDLKVIKGEIVDVYRADLILGLEVNPFYDNLTIKYSGSKLQVMLSYKYDHASLMIGDKGFFMSPLLLHSEELSEIIDVNFSNLKISIENTNPKRYDKLSDNLFRFKSTDSGRVMIFFKSLEIEGLLTIKEGDLLFETPKRYEGLAREVLNYLDKVYEKNLTWLFNTKIPEIKFHFYLPQNIDELGIGGYTPYYGDQLGDIYINILYVRGVKGQLELISLHELVHRLAHKSGIDPYGLLWVHEGLAEYISVTLGLEQDLKAAEMRKRDLEHVASKLNNFGFLEDWKPSSKLVDTSKYYSAAYKVISYLGESYGGFRLYHDFFKALEGRKISSTKEFVQILSEVSGYNLTTKFINWGFKVGESTDKLYALAYKAFKEASTLPWWMQPVKIIAEQLADLALKSIRENRYIQATLYAALSIAISNLGIILEIIIILLIVTFIVLIFKKTRRSKTEEYYLTDEPIPL